MIKLTLDDKLNPTIDSELTLDRCNDQRVEHNISPPMACAVTIPVRSDGHDTGIAVYVVMSPFHENASHAPGRIPAFLVKAVASRIEIRADGESAKQTISLTVEEAERIRRALGYAAVHDAGELLDLVDGKISETKS